MSGRFQDIAEQHLTVVLRGPSEWMAACPFCEGKASFQFNIDKGLWNCFRCGEGGGAKKLVQKMGGNYVDPAISADFLHQQFDRMRTKHRITRAEEEQSEALPETSLLRYGGPTHEYWKERNFSEATIQRWDLGYDPISDRCIIPFRNTEGDLLGVIQRRLDDVFPRYIYPKNFDRSGHLFGSWEIVSQGIETAALVEGSTDSIKIFQANRAAVAQYGSFITEEQVRLLRKLGIRRVVLFYDYDEAGIKATEDAQTKCEGFLLSKVVWDKNKYCWHAKHCDCGEHTWRTIAQCNKKVRCKCGRQHNMDPGKLSSKEIRSMYDNPVRIGSRKKEKWHTRKHASSKNVRVRHTGR